MRQAAELFHGFNCKADRPVIFTEEILEQQVSDWGVRAQRSYLITLAIACPGLDHVSKVQSLGLPQLLTVYGLAFLNIPVRQLMKLVRAKVRK